MLNAVLFFGSVLIWGTTWLAVAYQVGEVPVVVTIFYRFAFAALLMLGGLALAGQLKLPRVWRFVVVQALCCFSLNFIAIYNATSLIPSGLVAVIFSLTSVFNAVNARIFFGERITRRVVVAAMLGVTGLVLLLWNDLAASFDARGLHGVGWAILGTLLFSWGNMASLKNSTQGVSPLTANAWGTAIGAVALLALVQIAGLPLMVPSEPSFWFALAYLVVFGSVIGFTAYLTLVARVGSAKAGYLTVLTPVVALLASTLFEGYQWSGLTIIGLLLTGLGNVVLFRR